MKREAMKYDQMAAAKAAALQAAGQATILAIESSCDETAAAVVQNGRGVLGNAVYTQIPIHRQYGGVVPEIASRNHVDQLGPTVQAALEQAGIGFSQLDAIAVTAGPGLIGALLTGVSYAKGLAYSLGLPLVGVDHIAGHIAANYITHPDLQPPFCCLVASGGHSHILLVEDYCSFRLLGHTRDDAAGEAFDKVARVLGLPYPGGPALEQLAREGNPEAFYFPAGFNASRDTLDFSFSGLKTAVINALHNAKQKGEAYHPADVAASFQHNIISVLCERGVRGAKQAGMETLALAGGVSANQALCAALEMACKEAGLRFCKPEFRYCTDNAAMIGCAGFYALMAGERAGLDLNGEARPLGHWGEG